MKHLICFIFSMLLLMTSTESAGQALLTRHDSVRVKKDTTIHLVIKDFRGNIQWQKSLNGILWSDLAGKTTAQLIIQPDQEVAYRAKVTEGTCIPVYSDSAVILFLKATVSTNPVTDITDSSAVCGGVVMDDGGAAVTLRGVCWNTAPEPTVADDKTINGPGTGSFTAYLTGLTANTPYYVRAYATNSKGTAYGNQVSFTTKQAAGETVTDIDGNVYPTIKIGEQTWMKENLRVIRAPDGDSIVSSLCNAQNEKPHGRLYSWDVAMNGSTTEKAQGICPTGWHIPSDEEIKILEIYLGMTRQLADLSNTWRGSPVGTHLKVGGSSGFNLPLAGLTFSPGYCYNVGLTGYLYTSTISTSGNPWRRCFDATSAIGRWDTWPKSYGLSIRCVKN